MKLGKPIAVVLVLCASTALANGTEDRIVQQLKDQGYDKIEVSRTWLGRARIEAYKGGLEREIIVNPRTGEIMRDYWEREDPDDDDDDDIAIVDPDGDGEGPDDDSHDDGDDSDSGFGDADGEGEDPGDSDSDGDSDGDGEGHAEGSGEDGGDGDD